MLALRRSRLISSSKPFDLSSLLFPTNSRRSTMPGADQTQPDERRRRRRHGGGDGDSSLGSRSAPVGKAPTYSLEEPSTSSKSLQTTELRQRRAFPERGSAGAPVLDAEIRPFDICKADSVGPVKLNLSLLAINKEKRRELKLAEGVPQHRHLGPGMVLLKKCISHHDQVKIVQRCREIGMGVGGFYRPGYSDGAKLHLQMMCLGKNWDPQSRSYDDRRPVDGALAPKIPEEFKRLVETSIRDSHDFIRRTKKVANAEDELPGMSPDVCIVNFYGESGRLGLHKDSDESKESIQKGLPVISFSLGDSAEFLYGLERDVEKAEKVVLESGDVLLFGGRSREIFHGVSSIQANTAPRSLIQETNLRPGRLNLTFRQY